MTDRKPSAHPSSLSFSIRRETIDLGTTIRYEFIFFLHITVPYASPIRRKDEEKSKGIHAKTHAHTTEKQKKNTKKLGWINQNGRAYPVRVRAAAVDDDVDDDTA